MISSQVTLARFLLEGARRGHCRAVQDAERDLTPGSHPQLVKNPFVLPPVLPNLDVQVEKDLAVQHLLEIPTGIGADALDHLAALADHDRLLRLTLDEDRRVNAREPAFRWRILESIDQHR